MIQSPRGLVITAVVVFVLGLLVSFPARVAYSWFAPPNISLSGINGSLWSGNAREATADGLYVRELKWRVRPQYLLLAKLAFAIEAESVGGFLDAKIALSPGGSVTITDLNASLDLKGVSQLMRMPGLDGTATLRFPELRLEDGIPVAVDGTMEVAGLVAPLIWRSSIGGYRAEFVTANDDVIASVEDTDGVVDLAGSLRLTRDGKYEFLGQLAPKPETPDELQQRMQFLGSADERGQRELRLEGTL